jgi:hypothetical protein
MTADFPPPGAELTRLIVVSDFDPDGHLFEISEPRR